MFLAFLLTFSCMQLAEQEFAPSTKICLFFAILVSHTFLLRAEIVHTLGKVRLLVRSSALFLNRLDSVLSYLDNN